jgi:hypothetical protein
MKKSEDTSNKQAGRFSDFLIEYDNLPYQPPKPTTIPGIFNKTYDENFLSDYLAYILNPFENGIGMAPLNKLLELSKTGEITPLEESLSPKDISLEREYTFRDQKRIDLLINVKDEFIITIENKILSIEGNEQTKNYTNALNIEFPEHSHICFFLSPSFNSKPLSDGFLPLSYMELYEMLKPLVKHPFRSDRKRILFMEFVLHVKEYIMTSSSLDLSEKSKLYLKHKDVIDDLLTSFRNNTKDHFNYISEIIKNVFPEDKSEWIFDFNPDRTYQKVFKSNWPNNRELNIHFEFELPERSIFLDKHISFMLDTEGKRKAEFRKEFKKNFGLMENQFEKNNIHYLKNGRSIAWKNYEISMDRDNPDSEYLNKLFRRMFDDFSFLIHSVDEVLKIF